LPVSSPPVILSPMNQSTLLPPPPKTPALPTLASNLTLNTPPPDSADYAVVDVTIPSPPLR
jgi:hypothetical protein